MSAQTVGETGGALQTSLKVTLSGAAVQLRDTRSKLSMHPEPPLCETTRA
jgi:hypothetical protein